MPLAHGGTRPPDGHSQREVITWSDAKVRGLARYYTGKPCRHGHIAERTTKNGYCVECNKLRHKRAYPARYQKNRDAYIAYSKKWAANNPEKARAKSIKSRRKHADRVREYYQNNKERHIETAKMWRKNNPSQISAYGAARRIREINQMGVVSPDIRERLRTLQKGKCAYCHVSLKKAGEHLDHIAPLKLGGMHEDANFQLLCPTCNCRKNAKDPLDFARELGRLL